MNYLNQAGVFMVSLSALTFSLCLSSGTVMAQAGGFNMGPLSPLIQTGSDGIWAISNDNGRVFMRNNTDPSAITYFYVNADPGQAGKREVSVDIEVLPSSAEAFGGLLYGYQETPKSYFLYTLGADDSINLHYMHDGKFDKVLGSSLGDAGISKAAGRTRLTLRENGQRLTLLADGQVINEINSDRLGHGATGIVAFGVGDFRFGQFDSRINSQLEQSQMKLPDQSRAISAPQATSSAKTVLHDIIDPNTGRVVLRMPLPPSWKVLNTPGDLFAESPDGIKIFTPLLSYFSWTDDPTMLQTLQMNRGTTVARWIPLQQHIEQVIKPILINAGFSLVNTYPLPAILKTVQTVSVASTGSSNIRQELLGTEWQHRDGSMMFALVQQNTLVDQVMTTRQIEVTRLTSPKAQFESARDAYIYARSHVEIDPTGIQASKGKHLATMDASRQRDAERMAQLQAGHQARMAAIAAAGQTSRSVGATYSEILDISHAGYMNRSNTIAAGQAAVVDALSGHQVISNTDTGERYRIDGNSRYYWVGQDGTYIGTDNPNYDPRLDRSINQNNWAPFDVQR